MDTQRQIYFWISPQNAANILANNYCRRKITGRSEGNIDVVRLNIATDPNISIKKLLAIVETSKAT